MNLLCELHRVTGFTLIFSEICNLFTSLCNRIPYKYHHLCIAAILL